MFVPPAGGRPEPRNCTVCQNAEKIGGAMRCRACGRWIPRVDRNRVDRRLLPRTNGSDRRARTREEDPPCPRCRPDQAKPRVTIRLPQRVFFKCDACRSVWTLELSRR